MSEKKQSVEEMAAEYLQTAERVKKRLDELSEKEPTQDIVRRRTLLMREYNELMATVGKLEKHCSEEDKYGYLPRRSTAYAPMVHGMLVPCCMLRHGERPGQWDTRKW